MSDKMGIVRIEGMDNGEPSTCIIKNCRIVLSAGEGAVNRIFVDGIDNIEIDANYWEGSDDSS